MLKELSFKNKITGWISMGLLLAVLSPLLLNIKAHATNNYNITVASEVHIGGESPNGNCETADMTARWVNFMSTDTSNKWSYKNTWNYTNNYNNSRQKLDEFQQYFTSTQTAGSGWIVAMLDGSEAGIGAGNKIIRLVLFDGSQNVNIVQGGLQIPSGSKVSSFMVNPNMGCRFQSWEENDVSWGLNNLNHILLAKGSHINYPLDYSGDQIPNSPPAARNYVALGDSFSSGEGNPPFESGTHIDKVY